MGYRPPRILPLNALALVCLLTVAIGVSRSAAQGLGSDEELQMGQQVFNELKAKGEIIESSPPYDQLRPIADAITRIAQPRYNYPFKFYLVHESQPNAFVTPEGNLRCSRIQPVGTCLALPGFQKCRS
jgi:predicted Zn-dependent protease